MITFRICKPRANARGGGTAFPICLCLSQTLPSNTKLWSLDSPRPACLDLGASPVLAGPIVLDQWLLFWKAPPWPTNKSLPLLVISVTRIYLFSRYWTAAYSTRSIWPSVRIMKSFSGFSITEWRHYVGLVPPVTDGWYWDVLWLGCARGLKFVPRDPLPEGR